MAPVLPWALDGILANVSQGTALATYFFLDPWNLQAVALFSATTQVLFYFLQRPPVWIFVFWNVLQFCINAVQIVRLALDTAPVLFAERELQALALFLHCFDSVPSRKIARVLRRCGAAWIHTKAGGTVEVLNDGEGDYVHFVVAGCVEAVAKDGHTCYRAEAGGFVGEASLAHAVSGTLPDYDALDVPDAYQCVAMDPVITLRWPVTRLARVLRGDAELMDAFREALALDFYAKLEREEAITRRGSQSALERPSVRRKPRAPEGGCLFERCRKMPRPRLRSPATPLSASSRRKRRRDSVNAVVAFVTGAATERASLYRDTVGYEASESPRQRYRDAASAAAATSRPRDDRRLRTYQRRATYLRTALCGVVVGASVFLAYDDGAGSFLGNASQTLVTGAFAIQDPLRLNVVAGCGSLFQILFFAVRSERIWSAIFWSVAQLGLNFYAIGRLYAAPVQAPHAFGDKELFVARVLQRAGGLHLSQVDLHQLLLGGSRLPPPAWDDVAAGEVIPTNRAALLCNGCVVVTRPEDGSSRRAYRGALLHSDVVAKRLDALPPESPAPALAPSRSFSSVADEPAVSCRAAEACEVLNWDVDALVEFLRERRDVRLCVNALIASAKLESYMHLDH